jgi:acetyl esterase/lipase
VARGQFIRSRSGWVGSNCLIRLAGAGFILFSYRRFASREYSTVSRFRLWWVQIGLCAFSLAADGQVLAQEAATADVPLAAAVPAEAPRPQVIIEEGLVYSTPNGQELKLDLARPAGEGPFPAIVFIHGGGWYLGDRSAYRDSIEEAARRGYVAATVSYRLMKFDAKQKDTTAAKPIFPAQVHDVKAAVRWLRANAEKYHIDPSRIGATGASAGGHLSLMLGLTDQSANLEGDGGNTDQSSRVQAVVNVFGPTEMASAQSKSTLHWLFRLFLDGTPEESPENYKAASPLTYVSSDDPPVLTLQGDLDPIVPVDQATRLDEAMKAAGAPHTLHVYKGQKHGFTGQFRQQEHLDMWTFFDECLKP